MFQKLLWTVVVFAALVQGSPVPETPGKRILGGSFGDIKELPFMASLQDLNDRHFCGATIISNRWVITAAHCTEGSAQNGINVVVGTSVNVFVQIFGGFTHRSSRIVMHPDFNINNVRNDIALIEVETPFKFGANVKAIKLPTAAMGAGRGVVAGWGYLTHYGPASTILFKLNLEVLSHQDCDNRIGGLTDWFEPNKICSLTMLGQGHCFGDSGGPLFVEDQIVGIVSFVFIPCGSTRPDVFERVFPHIDFIKRTTNII